MKDTMASDPKFQGHQPKEKQIPKRWFAGDLITNENKKAVYETYKKRYIANFKPDKELGSDKWDENEIDTVANAFAKYEVKKQEAHLKAFLKGKNTFKFMNREFPVLASTSQTELMLSDLYPEMLIEEE